MDPHNAPSTNAARLLLEKAAHALWSLPIYDGASTLLVGGFFFLDFPQTTFSDDLGFHIDAIDSSYQNPFSLAGAPPDSQDRLAAALRALGASGWRVEAGGGEDRCTFVSAVVERPSAHALLALRDAWHRLLPADA